MKIGIAGYGMVGRAHYELLKDRYEVAVNDPALDKHEDFSDADCIIVCVSTPPRADGSCHMDNVYEVLEDSPDVPILIKSTISIEGWRMLKHVFPTRMMTFSPEFLRAASAVDDLTTQKVMLIGGNNTLFWQDIFDCHLEVSDPEALIIAKYARNSFLALKVAYFNQIYDLCCSKGIDYEAVRYYTAMDNRIGDSHMSITSERGFGGHCFPKDTQAIISSASKDNVDLSILKEAVVYNNNIRVKSI